MVSYLYGKGEDLFTSETSHLGYRVSFLLALQKGQTAWSEQSARSLSALTYMMASLAIRIAEPWPRSAVEPEPSDCCGVRDSEGVSRTLRYLSGSKYATR